MVEQLSRAAFKESQKVFVLLLSYRVLALIFTFKYFFFKLFIDIYYMNRDSIAHLLVERKATVKAMVKLTVYPNSTLIFTLWE